MLKVENVSKSFGGLAALTDVSFEVPDGKVLSLIGPNGSGKSTMFNVITGVYGASSGRVSFEGKDITRAPSHRIAAMGLVRTFQMTRIFPNLSVTDNVLIGEHVKTKVMAWQQALGLPAAHREEEQLRETAHRILGFVGLAAYGSSLAGNLSIGQRRILQLGMTLASEPRVLLLDEPAAGLSPTNAEKLIELIHAIRERWQISILLVEHAMSVVMAVSDRVAVLNFGRLIAEGTPSEVRENPAVIEAYLGTKEHAAA